jgi:hypothetical protein
VRRAVAPAAFTPATLFGTSDQGVWYDPSDFSTLFQDSAGTTPVTALEQPVGLMLDKSGRGNHATQPTATSRPVVSARVNLLTKTEELTNAAWTKESGTTVSSTLVAAPDGSLTAFTVTGDGLSGVFQAPAGSASLGQTTRAVYLRVASGAATVGIKDPVNTQGITTCNLTTTWQQFTLTETTPPTGGFAAGIWIFNIPRTGIEVAWPDLRVANDGVNLPPYQRVNTATDYDSVGFPVYLRADGVDDGMVTNSINFTATDKMTAVVGVRKLSDATTMAIAETSNDPAANDGTFSIYYSGISTVGGYGCSSKGTITAIAPITGLYPSPITNVLTGIGNISGDSAILRVNAIQAAISTTDQGTGNYGNYPLYLFRRGGTTLPFNGRFYGMTIVNKLLSTTELAQLETYTNGKTRAFVPPPPVTVSALLLENSDKLLLEDGSLILLET